MYGELPWWRRVHLHHEDWDIVLRTKGKSIVSSKCLYKIKHTADGSIEKFKARFVARGHAQKRTSAHVFSCKLEL
jgi:hypothetical protein